MKAIETNKAVEKLYACYRNGDICKSELDRHLQAVQIKNTAQFIFNGNREIVKASSGLTDYERDRLLQHSDKNITMGMSVRHVVAHNLPEQDLTNIKKYKDNTESVKSARMAQYKPIFESINPMQSSLIDYMKKLIMIKLSDNTYYLDRIMNIAYVFISKNADKLDSLIAEDNKRTIVYYDIERAISAAFYSVKRIQGYKKPVAKKISDCKIMHNKKRVKKNIQANTDRVYSGGERKLLDSIELLELQQTESNTRNKTRKIVSYNDTMYRMADCADYEIMRSADMQERYTIITDKMAAFKYRVNDTLFARIQELVNKGKDNFTQADSQVFKRVHTSYGEDFFAGLRYDYITSLICTYWDKV